MRLKSMNRNRSHGAHSNQPASRSYSICLLFFFVHKSPGIWCSMSGHIRCDRGLHATVWLWLFSWVMWARDRITNASDLKENIPLVNVPHVIDFKLMVNRNELMQKLNRQKSTTHTTHCIALLWPIHSTQMKKANINKTINVELVNAKWYVCERARARRSQFANRRECWCVRSARPLFSVWFFGVRFFFICYWTRFVVYVDTRQRDRKPFNFS